MERRLRVRLRSLSRSVPAGSPQWRLVRAALAGLERGGIGNFLLENEALLAYWRREARSLEEIRAVALLSHFLKSAYAAVGVDHGGQIEFVPHGREPDHGLGACPFCEQFLDADQRCFGCHLPLCTSCDARRGAYPLCKGCAPVWTNRRVAALFAAFLSLPAAERTQARFARLQEEMGAALAPAQARQEVVAPPGREGER
jgi:hypothetical protein